MQRTLAALPFTDLDAFKLRPEGFKEHLTSVVGFEFVCERRIGEAAKGFDRPLLVFRRPAAPGVHTKAKKRA